MFEIGDIVKIIWPTEDCPAENYPVFERFMNEFIGQSGKVVDIKTNPYEHNHCMYHVEFPVQPYGNFPPTFWFNFGWIKEDKINASSWNELL